jgi:catechol 2,3-dioxygenase-like lactoylglutathione lyase family enzyme
MRMTSPWIAALRSVAIEVPDLVRAEAFYTEVWRLEVAARGEGATYFRGTGADAYLLALHAGSEPPRIRHVTLRARSADALSAVAEAAVLAGGRVVAPIRTLQDPAGGTGLTIRDPDGRLFQIVHGDSRRTETRSEMRSEVTAALDRPHRLAHAVLNSHDVASTQRFLERALGFVLADRTRIMAFMNCDRDHHSLAIGDTDNDALNHIAFLMPSLDAVMRGGGRMRDHGHPIEWGPGRHGPGNNTFNYFIDPFGVVIEYTADVAQIDDSYDVRGPTDWTWPPGRVDQWGIGIGPTDRLKQAQRRVFFVPS